MPASPACTCTICSDPDASKKTGLCKSCSSSRYYWKGRSTRQILHRRARLAVYADRLDYFFIKSKKDKK